MSAQQSVSQQEPATPLNVSLQQWLYQSGTTSIHLLTVRWPSDCRHQRLLLVQAAAGSCPRTIRAPPDRQHCPTMGIDTFFNTSIAANQLQGPCRKAAHTQKRMLSGLLSTADRPLKAVLPGATFGPPGCQLTICTRHSYYICPCCLLLLAAEGEAVQVREACVQNAHLQQQQQARQAVRWQVGLAVDRATETITRVGTLP
jgi:hypothetical protein